MKPRSIALLAAAWPMIAGTALAADVADPAYRPSPLPPPPVLRWTGLYVGINGGYGAAKTSSTVVFTGGSLNGVVATGANTLPGGIAGGQVGYNWQMGPLVFGPEADWQWSGQQRTFVTRCGATCVISDQEAIKGFGTARGRLGFAMNRFLFYGTGGAAWTDATQTLMGTSGAVTANLLQITGIRVGWTAGAGIEMAFLGGGWSAKAEYLYISTPVTGTAVVSAFGNPTVSERANLRDHIVRAGINYRFWWW
jgi:outer membrane immunogenic protein